MSTPLGSVLIGGGSGFIGTHLSKLLRNKGYAVTIISRMPGLQRISWNDLHRTGLPPNTTAVVNLAGQNVLDATRRWTAGFKQNVFNSRINTTAALAQAITESSVKPSVFVTVSGVGIYKPHKSMQYDETSKTHRNDLDYFSHLCHEWEDAARLPHNADQTRLATIRSGVVLGRKGGMIRQIYVPFYLGLGGPIGDGTQYLPWIHVADLTRLILFAIENDKVKGVLNGVAPENITSRRFAEAFAQALRRPAVIPLPKFVVDSVFSEERANMLTQGQIVVPKRVKSFGFSYVFPDIVSACQEIVNTAQDAPH